MKKDHAKLIAAFTGAAISLAGGIVQAHASETENVKRDWRGHCSFEQYRLGKPPPKNRREDQCNEDRAEGGRYTS
jgi:hypothetical protein